MVIGNPDETPSDAGDPGIVGAHRADDASELAVGEPPAPPFDSAGRLVDDDGWSGLDELIIAGLAAGWSYGQCAEELGGRVSARTIRRKMTDPAFRAEVDARQEELMEQAVRAMSRLVMRAVIVVGDSLTADLVPDRLRGAREVLTQLVRLRV